MLACKKGGNFAKYKLLIISITINFSANLILTLFIYYFNYFNHFNHIIMSLAIAIAAYTPRNRIYGRPD
jgi:hypothetical protein